MHARATAKHSTGSGPGNSASQGQGIPVFPSRLPEASLSITDSYSMQCDITQLSLPRTRTSIVVASFGDPHTHNDLNFRIAAIGSEVCRQLQIEPQHIIFVIHRAGEDNARIVTFGLPNRANWKRLTDPEFGASVPVDVEKWHSGRAVPADLSALPRMLRVPLRPAAQNAGELAFAGGVRSGIEALPRKIAQMLFEDVIERLHHLERRVATSKSKNGTQADLDRMARETAPIHGSLRASLLNNVLKAGLEIVLSVAPQSEWLLGEYRSVLDRSSSIGFRERAKMRAYSSAEIARELCDPVHTLDPDSLIRRFFTSHGGRAIVLEPHARPDAERLWRHYENLSSLSGEQLVSCRNSFIRAAQYQGELWDRFLGRGKYTHTQPG